MIAPFADVRRACRRRNVSLLLQLVLLGVVGSAAWAAPPQLSRVEPLSLQIGQQQELALVGQHLAGSLKLIGDLPLAEQKLATQQGSNRAVFSLRLAGDAAPGIYWLKVAGPEGVSQPLPVAVDRLPTRAFAAGIDALPIALEGSVTGNTVLQTEFTAKAGQRLVIDVQAARLGAKLRPTLRLLDSRGVQLAWSGPQQALHGDARLIHTLPADGVYQVQLHDLLYAGPGPGHFRLRLGDLKVVAHTTPAALSSEGPATVTLLGPGLGATGREIASTIPPGSLLEYRRLQFQAEPELMGPIAPLLVSGHAEQVEGALPNRQLASPPSAVTGVISAAGEVDRYRLPVAGGEKLHLQLQAAEFGSRIDGVLATSSEPGGQPKSQDDAERTSDPVLEYDVPPGAEHVVITVRDFLHRGGDDFHYRLVVADRATPQVTLALESSSVAVPGGGTSLLQITAQRHGYHGPLNLQWRHLPAGITSTGTLHAGQDRALLSLAAETAAGETRAAVAHLVATTSNDTPPHITALAEHAEAAPAPGMPQYAQQFAVAVVQPAPLQVVWEKVPQQLQPGGAAPASVSLQQSGEAQGKLRLRLITSQTAPQKKEKQDGKEIMVDDVENMLRLQEEVVLEPNAARAELSLIAPASLPPGNYSIAIQVERLSPDGKQVLSTAATSVHVVQVAK